MMSEDQRKVWNSRLGALPRIPRGENGYLSSLLKILELVNTKAQSTDELKIKGSKSKKTLEQCCIAIRPYGLVEKLENHTWAISSNEKHPRINDDPEQWFRFFVVHTKFLGELLAETESIKSVSELFAVANEQFNLGWKSYNQISSRLNWLMDMGLIEIINHYGYKTTSKGLEYLSKITLIDSKYTKPVEDVTIGTNFSGFNAVIAEQLPIKQSQLENRKESLGYFLGGNDSLLTNAMAVLSVITNKTPVRDIIDYSTEAFGVKESSITGYISMLAKTQLVEYAGQGNVAITKIGQVVANGISWIDLFGIFHSNYKFMGEILSVVKSEPKSYKQISQFGRISFGIESMSVSAVQRRCSILKNAQLIRVVGKKLVITSLGRKVLDSIVISKKIIDQDEKTRKITNNMEMDSSSITELITEIEDSSRDSSHSKRFEKVLAHAFARMGFATKWIGGPGDTDIFVTTQTATKYTYTFNVDAKATYSGTVGESMVNFDTLEQHRKMHNSDYVIVVGAEFSTNRIIDWAKEHHVGLLDTSTLIDILTKHEELPLTADQYRKVFEQSGRINAAVLDTSRNTMKLNAGLIRVLVRLLINESRDSVSGGLLTPKDLYFLIRSTKFSVSQPIIELSDPISTITTTLDFLSSPFINIVGHNNNGYFAKGSRIDAAQKFQFYAEFLQE